jgi:ferredoxin
VSARIQVSVDRDRCVGSGNCEFWAPGLFQVGDDGYAAVVGDAAQHAEAAELATKNCPTDAIGLTRDTGGE